LLRWWRPHVPTPRLRAGTAPGDDGRRPGGRPAALPRRGRWTSRPHLPDRRDDLRGHRAPPPHLAQAAPARVRRARARRGRAPAGPPRLRPRSRGRRRHGDQGVRVRGMRGSAPRARRRARARPGGHLRVSRGVPPRRCSAAMQPADDDDAERRPCSAAMQAADDDGDDAERRPCSTAAAMQASDDDYDAERCPCSVAAAMHKSEDDDDAERGRRVFEELVVRDQDW
jgi:hypothetical protein